MHCGGGRLRAQSENPDRRRDGGQVSHFRERDRIHSLVCGCQCTVQGDSGIAPSAALGAPVQLSTRERFGSYAWFCKCFSGGGVFAGGHGNWTCGSVAGGAIGGGHSPLFGWVLLAVASASSRWNRRRPS